MISDSRQDLLAIAQAIAPGWERRRAFIEDATVLVHEWMISSVALQRGETVLEVAAGAGDLGFDAATRIGESGRLIMTDFSPAMLDVARRRGAELGHGNVEYHVMDAQKLELDDESIDRILCRFALMLMPDPPAALAEARRVLRPGGRVVLAVWGPPNHNPFFSLIGLALVRHHHLPPPDPAEPGVFALADSKRLGAIVEGAGFTDVRLDEIPVVYRMAGVDEYLAITADTAGPLGLALRDIGPGERSTIADELHHALGSFKTTVGYAVPGVALAACAS